MNGVFQKSMLIFHAALFYKSGLSYTELSDLLEDEQFLMGDGVALPFDDCEINRDSSVTKTEGRNSIPLYTLGNKAEAGVDDGAEPIACFGPDDVEDADYTSAMVGKQKLLLLRQQLNQFCPPEKGQYDTHHTSHSKSTPPSYSAVEFRSDESLDHLLSLAISSKGDTQHVLFTAVSRMVDSNPSNSAVFVRHASKHVIALIRLIPHLPEKQCMMVAYLVCQILRIHTHYRAVEELIQIACQAEDNDTDADGADDAPFLHLTESGVARVSDTNPHRPQLLIIERLLRRFSSSSAPYLTIQNQVTHPATAQALYILGQSTKTDCPSEYLHFTAANPFVSGVTLKPMSHFPDLAVGYTVCTWVKLGDMGDKPFMTLMQLSPSSADAESVQSNAVLDLFFRLVQKTNNDSSAAGQQPGSHSPKAANTRTAQLCVSISHLAKLATSTQLPSIFDFSKNPGHALTAVSVPLSWSRIYPFGASTAISSAGIGPSDTVGFDLELSAGLSEWMDIARHGVEQLSGTERNDFTLTTEALSHQRTTSLLPPTTLQRASSIESTAYSAIEPESTGIVGDPALGVISSLSRCLMPDLVIDYDWIEGEQWHLLCVHHSGEDIKAWVDGQEKVILPWSYQGHSSNPQTQISLATTTADDADPKQYSESELFDDILPSLPLHNTFSQEYIATTRKRVAKLGYPLYSRVSPSCPYELHIGYLYAEQESYRGLLLMIEQSAPRLKIDYSNILQTHHTFIAGYSGGLGDTYVLTGRLGSEVMIKVVLSGAQSSILIDDSLAGRVLSKLSIATPVLASPTRLPIEPESSPAQASTVLKQPTPTKLPPLPLKRDPAATLSPTLTPRKPDRFSILRGSTPIIADALVGVGAGKDKMVKDPTDSSTAMISTGIGEYSPSVFHGEAVSRHQAVILSSALLKSSAGLAVLYPLLFAGKATQVVTSLTVLIYEFYMSTY